MALVCQGVVSQLRNHLQNGGAAMKIGVFRRRGFRRAFRSCEIMGKGVCEMALMCQRGVSQRGV